jgi:uncharacterized protein (DUF3084 family)
MPGTPKSRASDVARRVWAEVHTSTPSTPKAVPLRDATVVEREQTSDHVAALEERLARREAQLLEAQTALHQYRTKAAELELQLATRDGQLSEARAEIDLLRQRGAEVDTHVGGDRLESVDKCEPPT